MQAGKLKTRVAFQSAVRTVTAKGDTSDSWSTYATRWAEVRAMSGRMAQTAQQMQADADTQIRIRYTSLVKPGHRAVIGTRTLQVNAVLDQDGGEWELLLLCKELVAQ